MDSMKNGEEKSKLQCCKSLTLQRSGTILKTFVISARQSLHFKKRYK